MRQKTLLSAKVFVAIVVLLLAFCLPASADASCPGIHVVQPGETLTRIAARYGVTVQAIVRANGLVNPNFIWVGQRLVIPCGSTCAYVHVVQRGENLYRIALRYGVTVRAIARANHLANPNYIWVGQRLCIPTSWSPPPPCGFYYTVHRGDTLYSLALRYGTTVRAILEANGLWNPNYIWVGQRLYIPCGIDP